MRMLIATVTVAVVLVLGGCGQKGELYREPVGNSSEEQARDDED